MTNFYGAACPKVRTSILVYSRKDGTYSYTDQTLTFDEYEQEYWWRGTEGDRSFYDSEERLLKGIAPLLDGMTEL